METENQLANQLAQEVSEAAGFPAESENQESQELVRENTLFAEPLAYFKDFAITNSLINSWAAILVILVLALIIRFNLKTIPGRLQNAFEVMVEGFLGIFDSITGSRQRSLKFFPVVFAFFLMILINNWLGLLPGVGSVGHVVSEHGERVFVPFLRGATADLNTTLALAIIGVVVSHIFGVLALGWWKYLNKFINIKVFLEIPKKIRKDPAVLIVNPIKAFVGVIEIVGELAKIASLSFRLFGNIFAGEVLLASMSALFAFVLPVPFMLLEVIVGIIQALIFSMLILAYLTINTAQEEH